MKKRPLLIDCDPGVDDAFAIILAASRPEFDIVAINPVAGNVPLLHTTNNALRLAGALGLGCRVGTGADRPLLRCPRTAADVHGNNGMGGVEIPFEPVHHESIYAWDVLIQEARAAKGELEVVALGPLTNIATALLLTPEIAELIKHITIMGGSAMQGNVSPYAEFNIWVDPEACHVVLQSGIPITMCGLDGIAHASMNSKELLALAGRPGRLRGFLQPVAEHVARRGRQKEEDNFSICDLVTMACMVQPTMAVFNECFVSCEMKSSLSFGQTLVDTYHLSGKKANVRWLQSLDKAKYFALLEAMMDAYA